MNTKAEQLRKCFETEAQMREFVAAYNEGLHMAEDLEQAGAPGVGMGPGFNEEKGASIGIFAGNRCVAECFISVPYPSLRKAFEIVLGCTLDKFPMRKYVGSDQIPTAAN